MNRHWLALITGSSLALASFAPAQASDPLMQWAKERGSTTLRDIRAMPFVKAYAYLEAINEYCFPTVAYDSPELLYARMLQFVYMPVDMADKAKAHLAGDQSACGPAIQFLERTIADLPETTAKLEALIDERQIEVAGQEAVAEGEALYKTQQAERAAFETHVRNCKATAAEISTFATVEWLRQPHALKVMLDSKGSQLASCKDAINAKEMTKATAEIERLKGKSSELLRADELTRVRMIENAKAAEAKAFAEANQPVTCRFEGLPEMTITAEPGEVRWLTIGKEKPVRLFVGSSMSSATTTDGVQIVIGPNSVEIDGRAYEGSCQRPK